MAVTTMMRLATSHATVIQSRLRVLATSETEFWCGTCIQRSHRLHPAGSSIEI